MVVASRVIKRRSRRRGRVVCVAGQELYLTPTEHRLFEVLRGRPAYVVPRAELIELVMPDSVVLDRTIDVHVNSLRKKLCPAARSIQTVPRAGYRFVPTD